MEHERFDELIRRLGAAPLTRGAALRGLTGGTLAAVLGSALAANETDAKKKKKKKCKGGLTKCTVRRGKKKKSFCVDAQNDLANCGACGNACGGGNACNAPACDQGACGTTPTPDVSCDGGSGTCDAAGRCVATVCAGKTAANPCFPFDAGTCNTGGSTCRCGSDLAGNVACFENAYCLSVAEGNCASNADCVAKGFPQGSICFSAPDCCLSQFGCTTPCPT
jgi:hypothetical protein